MTHLHRLLAAFLGLALAASASAQRPGPVVLASGGPEALHAELREQLASPGCVRLLATATGEAREDWAIRQPAEPGRGPRAIAAALDKASVIVLEGGHASAWWYAFERTDRAGWLRSALRAARRRGATLIGFDGAASALAWAGIAPGQSLPPSHNPRRGVPEFAVVGGLGWAGGVMVECNGQDDQGLARLLQHAHALDPARALLLDGSVAWTYSATERRAAVSGTGRVWLFDLEGAKRTADGLRGARLDWLVAGDAWDLMREAPVAREGEQGFPASGAGAPVVSTIGVSPGSWSASLAETLRPGSSAAALVLSDPARGWRASFEVLKDSRYWIPPDDRAGVPRRLAFHLAGLPAREP